MLMHRDGCAGASAGGGGEQPPHGNGPHWPVRIFYEHYYLVQRERMASGSRRSWKDYRTQVNHLERYWSALLAQRGEAARPLLLSDLSNELVRGAMHWLASGGFRQVQAAPSVNKFMRAILAIWRFAIDEEFLPDSKNPRVKPYRETRAQPVCWTIDEIGLILESCHRQRGYVGDAPASLWWSSLVYVLYNTGLRITVAMHTPTANVDLDRGWWRAPADEQKDDEEEVLDLLPQTIEHLRNLRIERLVRVFDDWPYDRRQDSWPALNNGLRAILKRAELPTGRKDMFHKFRKSFASYVAIKEGISGSSSRCGHSGEKVTGRYIDPTVVTRTPLAEILPAPNPGVKLRLFGG